jgi:hypothetical protein
MSIHATVFGAAMLAGAMLFATSPANAQAHPCDSQGQRITCSQECCGRKSCPPSCESDCVRACVAACKDPGQAAASYQGRKRALQHSCGNKVLDRAK